MEKLIYSGSPHIRRNRSTRSIMIDVCIALLPAFVMSIVYFGVNALLITLISIIGASLAEIVYKLCIKVQLKEALNDFDFTSVVTGLLLGLNMPPFSFAKYWYIPLLSSVFAIIVVKMIFGGTGCNIVNPAISGRIFALISFTLVMTQSYVLPNISSLGGEVITTGATPLTAMLVGDGANSIFAMNVTNLDLLLGTGVAGSIGETCKIALIIGYLYLVIRGELNPLSPIIYIVVTGLFTVVLKGFDFTYFMPSILSGGLMLGAIFMATDYVTTPNTFIGSIIYFVLLGLLTAGLRLACKMEVVSFSIMLMNLIVPLIDKYIIPKPFGFVKKKKEEK